MKILICTKIILFETRLENISFDIWFENFGIQLPILLSVESDPINSAKQWLWFWPCVTKFEVTMCWEPCFIWNWFHQNIDWYMVRPYLSYGYWSIIDILKYLFDVPLEFCPKSSFGRFRVFCSIPLITWIRPTFLFELS